MNVPICAGKGALACIISSLMAELGVTEYTVKLEGLEEKLTGTGIETYGDFENVGDKMPIAFVVKFVEK